MEDPSQLPPKQQGPAPGGMPGMGGMGTTYQWQGDNSSNQGHWKNSELSPLK